MRVREQYVADVTDIPGTGGTWGTVHVKIRDTTSPVIEGGEEKGRVVYEYDRNYRMAGTFEPFRQLRDGVWYDYALISPDYTRFEVVDLQKGAIAAVEPYPVVTQEWLDSVGEKARAKGGWAAKYKVGDEMGGWGFCPVDFRVFDYRDRFDDETPTKVYKQGDIEKRYYDDEELYRYSGQWAIYSGCHWGDDSSWKMRYIDLSRISEGIVTSDERFGYFPLGDAGLKGVTYDTQDDTFYTSVEVWTDRKSGRTMNPGMKWTDDFDKEEAANG